MLAATLIVTYFLVGLLFPLPFPEGFPVLEGKPA